MNRHVISAAILAASLCIGGAAYGQNSSSSSSDSSGQGASSSSSGQGGQSSQAMTNDPDKLFLKMAAVDNMCEIQLSQMAQSKAQSQEVKQLAQHIMQDHQKTGEQLKQVAQRVGVEVPQQLPRMQQEELQMFSQLQGADFDKQFVSQMKAAHAKDISKFGDVAKIAKNDDVKQFAAQQLPALEQHGQMVVSLAATEGLGTDSLNQAQPAGATLSPGQGQGGNSSQGTSGGSQGGASGTSGGDSSSSGSGSK